MRPIGTAAVLALAAVVVSAFAFAFAFAMAIGIRVRARIGCYAGVMRTSEPSVNDRGDSF